MSINPFRYGKPIDEPAYFVGHRREVEQVYSRLLSAFESSSIVGERRIGKTSLLKILSHSDIQTRYGLDPKKYTFVYQDFGFLESSTVPTRFWQRVLKAIRRAVKDHEDIVEEIAFALKADAIDNYTLDDIFTLIDDEDLYIVLLMDEFENVTRNQNFDNDFFAGLRALAIHHNLALVTSSRQELIDLTHSDEVRSSPFFNIFASIRLRPFAKEEALQLIDTYLSDTEVQFWDDDLALVFNLTGYHPYFLQMVSHHLYTAHREKLDKSARQKYVVEKTQSEAEPVLLDYWHNSANSQKILLIVMALRAIEREIGQDSLTGVVKAPGADSGQGDTIENLERFYVRADQAIDGLKQRGLVIKHAGRDSYHLFSSALRELVAREIVGEIDDLRGWRNWQKDETLIGMLPTDIQTLMGQLVRHLNPEHRDLIGNWLLEPATTKASLKLLQNFLEFYEDYTVYAAHTFGARPPVTGKTAPDRPTESAQEELPDDLDWDAAIESLDQRQREQMILSLKKQILQHTGNLNKLWEQAASYGSLSSAPLKLQNEIEAIENTVTELQEKLDLLEQEI